MSDANVVIEAVEGKKGRAELSGCTLTSPEGVGLWLQRGATATMDGGSISGCGQFGVSCFLSGSTVTVRPPAAAPSAAPSATRAVASPWPPTRPRVSPENLQQIPRPFGRD